MTSNHRRLRAALSMILCVGALEASGYATACNGHVDSAAGESSDASFDVNADLDSSDAKPPAALDGPYRITCSVYNRDVNAGVTEFQRTSLVFSTDQLDAKSVILPQTDIPVEASLTAASDDVESVVLTVAFPRTRLRHQYTLLRNRMPAWEFGGFHGFTGLNYIVGLIDVQFICEASPLGEERPRPLVFPPPGEAGTAPPFPPTTPPTPVRIRCDVSVLESSGPRTESIVITAPMSKTLTMANRNIDVSFDDGAYDGRSLVLRMPGLQQLFQLSRSEPLTDITRGSGGLTGIATRYPGNGTSDGGSVSASDAGMGEIDTLTLSCTTVF